jgi:CheY-like chemotaxis protein
MLAYTLRGHGILLDLALDHTLPEVQADPDQLGQVVLNLVVNAQQALVSSSAEQRSGQRPRILITSGLEGQRAGRQARVWVRVVDNGPGVSAAAREHLFQPFFTTKSEGMGTGLGLSVSGAIVREHGGSLVLEEAGPGACFRLSLPLSGELDENALLDVEALAAEQPPTGRVLVVDDEPELAELMRVILEGAGLEVATAESGALALEMLHEARFDAVVSDVRMPDMDGPALWQAMSEQDPAMARRVLFVSGDMLSGTTQQWLRAQGLPSLDKPFSNHELLSALRRVMA